MEAFRKPYAICGWQLVVLVNIIQHLQTAIYSIYKPALVISENIVTD